MTLTPEMKQTYLQCRTHQTQEAFQHFPEETQALCSLAAAFNRKYTMADLHTMDDAVGSEAEQRIENIVTKHITSASYQSPMCLQYLGQKSENPDIAVWFSDHPEYKRKEVGNQLYAYDRPEKALYLLNITLKEDASLDEEVTVITFIMRDICHLTAFEIPSFSAYVSDDRYDALPSYDPFEISPLKIEIKMAPVQEDRKAYIDCHIERLQDTFIQAQFLCSSLTPLNQTFTTNTAERMATQHEIIPLQEALDQIVVLFSDAIPKSDPCLHYVSPETLGLELNLAVGSAIITHFFYNICDLTRFELSSDFVNAFVAPGL